MKTKMIRSLSLFCIFLVMALSVAAQEDTKVKTSDKVSKYKSEGLKIKDKKDEEKYKSADLKIKNKEDEEKYKSADLKIKDKEDERKVKAKVKPMQKTYSERTRIKTGETQVRVKEHLEQVDAAPAEPEPAAAEQVAVAKIPATVKKTTTRKYTAKKAVVHTAARKTPHRYIVRTKIVRDTVFVPSPPERVVSTEYKHDTVSVTRVDTVVKMQTQNTYTGYRVPRGDFKKVKLKRDKNNGDVWMKRKEKDGKTETDKQ